MTEAPRYRIHGLTVRSELPLPLLVAAEPGASADVEIAFEPVRDEEFAGGARSRNWIARDGRLLLHAYGIGRFRVEGGRRIGIEAEDGADGDDLVSMVQGSCLSAILHQRGLVPMHAGALASSRGAVLVMGHSGAGKSTLLAHLVRSGWTLMSDDVTAVDPAAPGGPLAHPAFPAMRLWADALEGLGHETARLRRVRRGIEKYYLPVAGFARAPMPLRAAVWTGRHSGAGFVAERVSPAGSVPVLVRNVHRKGFREGLGLVEAGFRSAALIAQSVETIRVRRPDGAMCPEETARRVEAHLASLGIERGA